MPRPQKQPRGRRKARGTQGPASLRQKAAAFDRERVRRQQLEKSLREMKQQFGKSELVQKRKTKEILDGQLQALYAVGLGLEVTRTLIEVSPRQASHELVQATATLNDLIQRLRSQITGLDLSVQS